MNRSIVTGGAGFIGSSLVRALLAAGHRVDVIDNLSTGKLDNLEEVADQITVYEYDLCDYQHIAPLIAGAHRVFHLGAIPSVPKSILDPLPSHNSNINGTFNVFRACAEGKVGRVVYAASSSAYGDTDVLPKVETMAPRPKSPYAVQKLLGEYYASVFAHCFNLETVSLRFFNVFGPRQDPTSPYSGVLSVFITCALENRSPTIFGDGKTTRGFTYIADAVAANILAMDAEGVAGEVFNTAGRGQTSINELVAAVNKILGTSIEPIYGDPRLGDIKHSFADISKAEKMLGYKPQVSLEEGLKRTAETIE